MDETIREGETNYGTTVIPFPLKVPVPSILERPKSALDLKFDGPLSGPMWKKSKALQSSFPDTFDYSVYDRLHKRFQEKPPRGGILFKTGLKLVNYHSSCRQCHYALELDTYGRGCTFNCSYCYAKEQLTKRGYWNEPQPFPIDLGIIKNIFWTVFETDKPSRWRQVLGKKVPLRIGSMSDSFMWVDRTYRVTHELLKILSFYDYPHIIFTRSDLVAEDDYLAVLNKKLASVQFSISGLNETLARQLEPGAPSVNRRLRAIEKLSKLGFWTTVRVNPLFPKYPDGYFTNSTSVSNRFGKEIPTFDLFDIDKAEECISAFASAGAPSVLFGFARLSINAISRMRKATGVDLHQFFLPETIKKSDDRKYSDAEVACYYNKLRWVCAKKGIRFSTCYIGNGEKDYFRFQNLWTNAADCCDAMGNVPSFRTTSQNIEWSDRLRFAPVGTTEPDQVRRTKNELKSDTELPI